MASGLHFFHAVCNPHDFLTLQYITVRKLVHPHMLPTPYFVCTYKESLRPCGRGGRLPSLRYWMNGSREAPIAMLEKGLAPTKSAQNR